VAHQAPLKFVFYIAATPEKVWEGFVSRESNRILFGGADFQADFKPGGSLAWVGAGSDGKPVNYVQGEVLRFEPQKVFQYTFAMGQNGKASRATIELFPESEATKVTVTHDEWDEDDPTYAACADGWPRILSRLKTLLQPLPQILDPGAQPLPVVWSPIREAIRVACSILRSRSPGRSF
jgi:uncharacterized protein YndB with AHSA1/START domain